MHTKRIAEALYHPGPCAMSRGILFDQLKLGVMLGAATFMETRGQGSSPGPSIASYRVLTLVGP